MTYGFVEHKLSYEFPVTLGYPSFYYLEDLLFNVERSWAQTQQVPVISSSLFILAFDENVCTCLECHAFGKYTATI